MSIDADLRQVIYALSDALDLVGVDDVAHGKRVGVMAAECGRVLGLSGYEVLFLFDLGVLHDIGVSSTRVHQHLVGEFDWAGSQEHAEIGYQLLRDFAPLARMALPVRYHHTRWEVLQAEGVADEVAIPANLILLVDRVDALAAPYYAAGTVLQQRAMIQNEIRQRSGSYFAPQLVEAFLQASAHEAFWLMLEPRALASYLQNMLAQGAPLHASNAELRQLAEMFAHIVDAKSPFTYTHSRGVARVARRLAEYLNVDPEQCEQLEIAGLLHDLGKLRIPDDILDKPGRLDEYERLSMNTHSFETRQILGGIRGFEDITLWAAAHHEEPGGRGYPFGLDGRELPLPARILRVADIFQAMVQHRPYRRGLSREAVSTFMAELQAEGRIEALIGDTLQAHLDELICEAQRGEAPA
ncbi:HD domain-containing phosphohydrolase [Pseudomonas sp. NW5]|uniref:HD-GYP domain-containing protein n=1 Tax=Pseudomonas sp. NW5 TaxID=2934934 RepID=UPI0020214C13|nr:HD domain-containing phosphohydrolase [Pseudomonas sp. NW5]MCL7461363.1 HD domain-containing protein [Pseudomonas sp. NW5]